MSLKAMAWVWDHSQSEGASRLVLLAIADCANADGMDAWPSMAELCRKTRLSERGVQKAIRRLEESGELKVGANVGRGRTNRYQLPLGTPHPVRDLQEPKPRTTFGDSGATNPAPRSGITDPETPNHVHPEQSSPPNDVRGLGAENPERRSLNPEPRSPGTVKNQEPKNKGTSATPPAPQKSEPIRADIERVCNHLADRIERNGSRRPTITAIWRREARLMIDREGRTVDQITKAIDWCQDHPFWRANVLSMPKLREKYDQMRLQAQGGQSGTGRPPLPASSAPTAIPAAERCPDHRGEIKGECRHCRAIAIGRKEH